MTEASYILKTSTADMTRIVAAISGFLAARRLSITEIQHFLDPPTSRSYLRTVFRDGGDGEQEVHRADHTLEPEELTNIGHDIESVTLNRAMRWHAEHRVFVHGSRTVVLR